MSCSGLFEAAPPRKAVKSIADFGGVSDGRTSNTAAFRRAVGYLERFNGRGGAQLNVPMGRWLTGSFNLTSDFTLFLHHGAVILGSQDPEEWPIIEPLSSYGRGRKREGGRYISLIHGNSLSNVVITAMVQPPSCSSSSSLHMISEDEEFLLDGSESGWVEAQTHCDHLGPLSSNLIHVPTPATPCNSGRLENISWSYASSIQSYDIFGDVVVFDTTHRLTAFDMPLGIWVGMNNYGMPCFFGCVLLREENLRSFSWAFKKLAMVMNK